MKNNHLEYDELKTLINKGVVRENTIITLMNRGDEEFRIKKCYIRENDISFLARSIDTKKMYEVNSKIINTIDGMEAMFLPEAFEEEFNTIEITEPTDIKQLFGKNEVSIGDLVLEEGMKIKIMNDKDPSNNKVYTMRKVKDKMEFIAGRGRPKNVNK